MQQPPLLPQEVLTRVLRISRGNGMSIMFVSGFFALLSALAGDFVGAIAGLVVAGAGAMEVHGGTLLNHYDRRGINWLISSQLVCLTGILVYCAVRLTFVQLPPIPDNLKAMIAADAAQLGITVTEFMAMSYRAGFILVAVVSILYQGGVAVYYAFRRPGVVRALEQLDSLDLEG